MGGAAGAVGVAGPDPGGAGGVQQLNVNDDVSARAVDVPQDKVRAVAKEGELEHEGSHAPTTLTDHTVRTNNVLTQVGELVTDWVVDGGVEAQAMGAGDEVAAGEGNGGEPASTGTHAAMHATELWRADEEVEGKGGGVVSLMVEGEPVTGGHAVKPGGGARAGGAVKEAGAAGGGGGVEEVKEVEGGDCSSGGSVSVWVGSHLEGVEAIKDGGRGRGVVGVGGVGAKGGGGGGEGAVHEGAVESGEAGLWGKAVNATRHKADGSMCALEALPRTMECGTEGEVGGGGPHLGKGGGVAEVGAPVADVVPDSPKGAVIGGIVEGGGGGGIEVGTRGGGGHGGDTMPTEAGVEGGEAADVYLRVEALGRVHGEGGKIGIEHTLMEGAEGALSRTRRKEAHEVKEARADAIEEEQGTLVVSVHTGIGASAALGKEEVIEDPNEASGSGGTVGDKGGDIGVGANRAPQNRVTLPDGDTVPTEHGVVTCIAVEAAIAKEAGGRAEEGTGEVPDGGRGIAGEVATVDRLSAYQGQAEGPGGWTGRRCEGRCGG